MDTVSPVQIYVTTAPVRVCILADQSAFTSDMKQLMDELGITLILKRPGTDAQLFTLPDGPADREDA